MPEQETYGVTIYVTPTMVDDTTFAQLVTATEQCAIGELPCLQSGFQWRIQGMKILRSAPELLGDTSFPQNRATLLYEFKSEPVKTTK